MLVFQPSTAKQRKHRLNSPAHPKEYSSPEEGSPSQPPSPPDSHPALRIPCLSQHPPASIVPPAGIHGHAPAAPLSQHARNASSARIREQHRPQPALAQFVPGSCLGVKPRSPRCGLPFLALGLAAPPGAVSSPAAAVPKKPPTRGSGEATKDCFGHQQTGAKWAEAALQMCKQQ